MVLKYKKISISLDDLFKIIPHRKDKGTIGPAILLGLEKIGINAKLIIHAPWLIKSLELRELKQILSSMKDKGYLEFEKNYLNLLLRAIKLNLDVELSEISPVLIHKSIRNETPIVCSVNSAVFRNKCVGRYIGHCIVVRGFDKNNFYINDPYWYAKNMIKVPKYRLMVSLYASKIPEILLIE